MTSCPEPTSVCKRCRTVMWRAYGPCAACATWLARNPPDREAAAPAPEPVRAWLIALVVLGAAALLGVEAMRDGEVSGSAEVR